MTTKLSLIGVVVADMAHTLAFYRLLGLNIAQAADSEPHVELELGGFKLAFDTLEVIRSFHPDYQPSASPSQVSLAFLCENPAEVDRRTEALAAAGYTVTVPPFDAFWGQRYATVLDPNKVTVDIFAPLPQS